MSQISPTLRHRLMVQRREIFASATHPFESIEPRALVALHATSDDHARRVTLRRWWIEMAGDLPADWESDLKERLAPIAAQFDVELETAPARPAWVEHDLLLRTIDVLQRRYLTTLRAPAALRALQSVGRLAVLGVTP